MQIAVDSDRYAGIGCGQMTLLKIPVCIDRSGSRTDGITGVTLIPVKPVGCVKGPGVRMDCYFHHRVAHQVDHLHLHYLREIVLHLLSSNLVLDLHMAEVQPVSMYLNLMNPPDCSPRCHMLTVLE